MYVVFRVGRRFGEVRWATRFVFVFFFFVPMPMSFVWDVFSCDAIMVLMKQDCQVYCWECVGLCRQGCFFVVVYCFGEERACML